MRFSVCDSLFVSYCQTRFVILFFMHNSTVSIRDHNLIQLYMFSIELADYSIFISRSLLWPTQSLTLPALFNFQSLDGISITSMQHHNHQRFVAPKVLANWLLKLSFSSLSISTFYISLHPHYYQSQLSTFLFIPTTPSGTLIRNPRQIAAVSITSLTID